MHVRHLIFTVGKTQFAKYYENSVGLFKKMGQKLTNIGNFLFTV